MANPEDRNEPPVGQRIPPDATPAEPFDVEVKVGERAKLTPTDRIEDRADLQIARLEADKRSLQAELKTVRYKEITHLRDDMRWLEGRESSLRDALATLKTSYEWAVSFNWFSFALVAIGGGFISYAAFLPAPKSPAEMDTRTHVATWSVAALLIGVLVQAFVSYRGTKTLTAIPNVDAPSPRPSPNPSSR